jgi:esterase/lipase
VKTVENPNRHINREIARWVRDKDLIVRGVNISQGLSKVTCPLLCVLANGDGIVPRDAAEYALKQVGSSRKELLVVGDEDCRLAHADMFVCNEAHERVFAPIAEWLGSVSGF